MKPSPQRNEAPAGHERPVKIADLGREAATIYHSVADHSTASVTPFPRRRQSLRRKASARLAQLYRLALFRREHGLARDGNTFVFAFAATLACGKPGHWMIRGRINRVTRQEARPRFVEWEGLDLDTLREAVRRADLGHFGQDELMTVIEAVRRFEERVGHTWIGAARLGSMLQLTSVERQEARVWSADALDEPAAERRKRKSEEKRMRDRETKRAGRGRLPRSIYEAQSKEKAQPWKAAGVSRATWYRRNGPAETSVSPDDIYSTQEVTHLSHGVAPYPIHAVEGPARFGGDDRSVGAGVPSHGGKTIEAEASRSAGASALEDEPGGAVIALAPRPRVAPPDEPPYPPLRPVVAHVVALIERAADVLQAIQERVPDTPDVSVSEAIDSLEGIAAMLWLSNADLPESADDTAREYGRAVADLIQYVPANDNRLATIARRLAA